MRAGVGAGNNLFEINKGYWGAAKGGPSVILWHPDALT